MRWFNSWFGVRGRSASELLETMGLVVTGTEGFPQESEALLCYAEFPGDWVIFFSEDFDYANPERLSEISALGFTVGLQFEDKFDMASTAFGFQDGVELWRVHHDNLGSVFKLEVTGDPPPQLAKIRARHEQEQRDEGGEGCGVDVMHEVPLELAKSVTGYRHDEGDAIFKDVRLAGVDRTRREPDKPKKSGGLFGLFRRS